ncbi:unnamed protein product [Rotaria sp. Silwood2]|nr:unnamed protein product [Rotaria sp. Silwood2]CAF4711738.1 unnamed protein product [Rotaria sp. Silwood2]
MFNKSTRIKAGLISHITAKLTANLHIDEIATSGDAEIELSSDLVVDAHSQKLFYSAGGLAETVYRLTKNGNFHDQQ